MVCVRRDVGKSDLPSSNCIAVYQLRYLVLYLVPRPHVGLGTRFVAE